MSGHLATFICNYLRTELNEWSLSYILLAVLMTAQIIIFLGEKNFYI